MSPDTPLDLLAKELGAVAGTIEREASLRLAAAVADFDRRAAEIELRVAGIDPGARMLPPDLAREVARAVRALHEAPELADRNEPVPPPRVVRIDRDADGNLVPIYDEPASL